MKKITFSILAGCMLLTFGCKHEKPIGCDEINFTLSVTKTDVTATPDNGTITAVASGGEGFTYTIGTVTNNTGNFTNLAAGTYTVTGQNSIGCSKSQVVTIESKIPGSPCTNNSIVLDAQTTPATPCATANGTITISATGSSGFTYSLNGGAYQTSNIYSGLSQGNYTITAKDLNGCTKSAQATVSTAAAGPNFTNMKNIINAYCGGCHINGGNSAGINYDNVCSIVNGWSKIREVCVTNSTMPPSGQLSSTLKAQITAWVNAGHRYTD